MSTAVQFEKLPPLDEPWRRLPWLVPAALFAWMLLLLGFALMLEHTAPLPAELKPIEARIIEMPVGGLQGGGGPRLAAPPSRPAPAPAQPKPRVAARPSKTLPKAHPKKAKEPPPMPSSPEGTAKSRETAPGPPSTSESSTASSGGGGREGGAGSSGGRGTGTGTAGGPGSDSVGARAAYAPVPKIPDDLREEIFQTEAVARFTVSYDGIVKVTLLKPTNNPRLNQLLLDTLRQWRFFPAVRDGVAINSVFDIRIPIRVQ